VTNENDCDLSPTPFLLIFIISTELLHFVYHHGLRLRIPALRMVWDKQPLAETLRRLDVMGIGTLVFDPCANRTRQGDFLDVMQHNVENLSTAYPLPKQGACRR